MIRLCIILLVCAVLCGSLGADQARRLTGKLVIPAGAGTKESYRSGNFQLLTRDGRVILSETTEVPASKLLGFRDRFVVVTAQFVQPQAANPDEQAPLQVGPDGKAVLEDHPEHYRVWSIEAYQGPAFKYCSQRCHLAD